MYTFLSKEEIEKLEKSNLENPHLREAHKALAREIITDLHGKESYNKALRISEALFSGDVCALSLDEIMEAFKDIPHFEAKDNNIIDFLVNNGVASSKREAREFVTNNSISINNKKINDLEYNITKKDALYDKAIIVRRGKKKYYIGIYK